MPLFELDDLIERGQYAREELFETEIGIEPCPYVYEDSAGIERFGLFKPYATSSIGEFTEDAVLQIIVNPISVLLGNLFLTAASVTGIFYNLYQSAAFTLGFQKQGRNDTPLLDASANLFGIGYFLVHAVVDTLWETLAAVTRTLSTFGLGVVNGLTAIGDSLSGCCEVENGAVAEDNDRFKAQPFGRFGY